MDAEVGSFTIQTTPSEWQYLIVDPRSAWTVEMSSDEGWERYTLDLSESCRIIARRKTISPSPVSETGTS